MGLYLQREISWLVGLCKEASFTREGASIMRILSEMERQGELREDDKRHALEVAEHVRYVELLEPSPETLQRNTK